MIEQSRNEKKLLAIERAKYRLMERLRAIDWEFDYLKERVAAFKREAKMPDPPSENIVDVQWDDKPTH